MKKITFLSIFLMTLTLSAQTFVDNGITYNVTSATAPLEVEVGDNTSSFAGGAVVIPETVSDGTNTYTVTAIADRAFEELNSSVANAPTSLSIAGTVKSIGIRAFIRCSGITSITFEEGIETIGSLAFFNMVKVTGTIELPSTITSLGTRCFERGFFSTFIVKNDPPLSITAIFNTYKGVASALPAAATLQVPPGTISAYQATANWSSFGTIEEYVTPVSDTTLDLAITTINGVAPTSFRPDGALVEGETLTIGYNFTAVLPDPSDSDNVRVRLRILENYSQVTSATHDVEIQQIVTSDSSQQSGSFTYTVPNVDVSLNTLRIQILAYGNKGTARTPDLGTDNAYAGPTWTLDHTTLSLNKRKLEGVTVNGNSISFGAQNSEGEYKIFNITGQAVQNGATSREVSIESLVSGVYILTTNKGSLKFVK